MFVPFKFSHYTPDVQLFLRRVDSPEEMPSPVQNVARVVQVPPEGDMPETLVLFFQDGTATALYYVDAITFGGSYQYLVEVPDRFAVVFLERVVDWVWTFTPPGGQGHLPVFATYDEAQSYAEQVVKDRPAGSTRPSTYVIHNVSELFQE